MGLRWNGEHIGMHRKMALASVIVLLAIGGMAYGQAPAAAQQVAMPDAEKIVLLLRTTLLTFNDAI